MGPQLCIIVPAYKINYLHLVFDSISSQTSKMFNLYVFDDASPSNVKALYDTYFSCWGNSSYYRFLDNLGGENLTAHWNRCVEHTNGEEWVWLFSDDDIMADNCVESILEAIGNPNNIIDDVLHFNISQVDGSGNITLEMKPYPQNITAPQYFSLLYSGGLDTRMPEFIFRRRKLEEIGGFVHFDLAWKSDNATVTAMTHPGTIFTVPTGKVYWRLSEVNITGSCIDEAGIKRKYQSEIDYFNWTNTFFTSRQQSCGLTKKQLFRAYLSTFYSYSNRSTRELIALAKQLDAVGSVYEYLLFLFVWWNNDTKGKGMFYRIKHLLYVLLHYYD